MIALEGEQLGARYYLAFPPVSRPTDADRGDGILEPDSDPQCDSAVSEFGTQTLVLGKWSSTDWMRLACMIWVAGTVTTLAASVKPLLSTSFASTPAAATPDS